ncbi:hypothetical protein VTK73DRAFT_6690 [Phialemonium thermophilum]|uniref:Nudix hydrolase domain-containing protein n=1 Tax=Phialemonium thermophilum TaxID=223376 RepID=A0ABR3WI93_9PEZI
MASVSLPRQEGHRPPPASFDYDPCLSGFAISKKQWLHDHHSPLDGICTGAVVFDATGRRVLLVQRASHDSMPNRWEVPGGAVDDEDANILHSAARELWEEAGLVAVRFRRLVPDSSSGDEDDEGGASSSAVGHLFTNRDGSRTYCRFSFWVEVESCAEVRLDPNEHQAYVWASEEEIRTQRIGEREMPITTPVVRETILRAFRIRAQDEGKESF